MAATSFGVVLRSADFCSKCASLRSIRPQTASAGVSTIRHLSKYASFHTDGPNRNPEEKTKLDEQQRSGTDTSFTGFRSSDHNKLYPGHIPTTLFQKCLLGAGSGLTAFFQPWRDDMVHYFGETSGYFALRSMRDKMMQDPVGQQILEEKPRINSSTLDVEYLRQLPEGSLGRAYTDFLEKYNYSPDDRLGVSFIDDVDLAYTMTRYREIHDLVHTVLGMPTNMLGEVVVKWVEALQTGLPMCYLGAAFSPLRFGPVYRERYLTTYLPWSLQVGTQAKTFLTIYFENHWEENLEDLKKQWNITPPPSVR